MNAFWSYWYFHIPNFVLAAVMYTLLGRLVPRSAISGEVGLAKPDPEIYLLTAKKLNLEPAECVFVDDLAINVRGAAEAGMVGVHHRSTRSTLEELEILLAIALRD